MKGLGFSRLNVAAALATLAQPLDAKERDTVGRATLGSMFAPQFGFGPTRSKRRNPHRTTVNNPSAGPRLVRASGPGSMDCEVEIVALIRAGKRDAALKLFEDDRDLCGRPIKRLAYWYELAKRDDPMAA